MIAIRTQRAQGVFARAAFALLPISIIAASSPACSSKGQTIHVRGTVTDYDGAPLSGVYVTSERVSDLAHVDPATLDGVKTAADGSFTLDVQHAEDRVVITAVPSKNSSGETT